MTTVAVGYLGFKLVSGETLLLPQGATFDLVRPVDTHDTIGLEGSAANPYLGHVTGWTTPVVRVPRKSAAKSPKPVKAGSRPDEATLDRNRKAVEAHGLTAAAKELGVNYATLYGQATRLGWKIPKVARAATKAVAAKRETRPTPKRHCESCQQLTNSDPCAHCGADWKRSK